MNPDDSDGAYHRGIWIEGLDMGARSYTEQRNRIMRWFNRLEKQYEGVQLVDIEKAGIYIDSCQDEVYAFFMNCYHLKDWINEDPKVPLSATSNVENFINSTECLRICADMCNRSKHSELTRYVRIDKDTELHSQAYSPERRYEIITRDNSDVIDAISEKGMWLKFRYEIGYLGKTIDALELAKSCIEKWGDFIAEHGLPVE